MNPVTFVICAAGCGTRMKPISKKIPKFLLKIQGKTFLEWSLRSLPIRTGDQVIFISRALFKWRPSLEIFLKNFSENKQIKYNFHYIQQKTSGQAETALLAKDIVQNDRLVLFNSDTYFECSQLDQAIHSSNFDGIIPCFKTSGNEWSFFKTNEDAPYYTVIDVAEKKRISDWCSAGFYYFKNGSHFFDAARKTILQTRYQCNEIYIAPLYKNFLASQNVKVLECEIFKPMGTPNQAHLFWQKTIEELRIENEIYDLFKH